MRRTLFWLCLELVLLVLVCVLPARESGAQEVILSLDRFHELWKKAHPAEAPPPPPSGSLAFETAEIAIVVEGEVARVSTTFEAVVSGELEQQLPLPEHAALIAVRGESGQGLTVEALRREGKPVLALRGAGRHRVSVESALALSAAKATLTVERRLELDLPKAARVIGSLTVDENVRQITAPSGGLLEPQGPGRWRFFGDPGGKLVLVLSAAPPAETKPKGVAPLVFEVESATALLASRARQRLSSYLVATVLSGELERLRVPVPTGFEVLTVSGGQLLGWELREGTLQLELRQPTTASAAFEVQLAADPEVALEPPLLVPEGAERVRGAVKVALRSSDGLLEAVDRRGAEVLAEAERGRFGPGFRDAAGEPLRLAAGNRSPRWRVTWATSGEVIAAQIDRLRVEAVVGESGTTHLKLWIEIRNGEPLLTLVPPAGARLLQARRGAHPLALGERDEGWVVPMVVQAGSQVVFLEALLPGVFPGKGGHFTLPLPRLSVPASRVEARLSLPPGFRYQLAPSTPAGAVGPPPGQNTSPEPPLGFSVVEASWSAWSSEPAPVVIDVTPLPRRSR